MSIQPGSYSGAGATGMPRPGSTWAAGSAASKGPGSRNPVRTGRSQYAVECQSSYERGAARDFLAPGVCFLKCHAESATWRPRASRQKGGMRWTLIVRAEVGPSRCYPILFRAHAGSTICTYIN